MEIIEIGACWTTEGGVVLERFQHLVRPLARPLLTPFCKQLIGITQEEVDQAPCFLSQRRRFRPSSTTWCRPIPSG
jgi:inhibitor of KinA sporulation pathway (predicted exonuclease)